MHLQLRADDDDRTGRVVDTLTEEVLTEATLLPLEAIGEGLEGTVVIGAYSTGLTRVVEEGVNSFLEHALFVAQDDFRRLDLDHTLQTIVTDDHTTIEVVEVRRSEASPIEGHERTEIGWDDGQHLHDHPLGAVDILGGAEALYDLKTLEGFVLTLL